jgi:hypothetical protein
VLRWLPSRGCYYPQPAHELRLGLFYACNGSQVLMKFLFQAVGAKKEKADYGAANVMLGASVTSIEQVSPSPNCGH